MKKEEKTNIENVIYKGKILQLNVDEVILPDGKIGEREIIHHRGGVCVLLNVDGKIPLVKQFRYAYKEETLELPAGKLEKDEDPYEAGLRELEEETGWKAESMIDFGYMYPSPGYTNEIIHMYVAQNAHRTEMHLDDDEYIDVFYYTIDEILELIQQNKINDAKTISLVLKYCQSIKYNSKNQKEQLLCNLLYQQLEWVQDLVA